jgi:PIN domain
MKSRVYIETSVISYLTARPSRDLIVAAQQELTRLWWEERRALFDCVISQAVVTELSRGDPNAAARRIEVSQSMALVPIDTNAVELARRIIANTALPESATTDALHISIAAISGVSYLLTWNCAHIANAEIAPKVIEICEKFGVKAPRLCTPNELMGAN